MAGSFVDAPIDGQSVTGPYLAEAPSGTGRTINPEH
jgi:hypothetical protein